MRIGYSFWGFLGAGITDTPDGGRSHRRPFIDGLTAAGHDIVFLQDNRDLTEAGQDLRDQYSWSSGFPVIDALFLEWRWPVPGRSTSSCGSPGHTCDLHRQDELIAHYTAGHKIPMIVWDKDLRLESSSSLRSLSGVAVCEAAIRPRPGSDSLLFPVTDTAIDCVEPVSLAALPRPLTLVYAGNQYDRDKAFSEFFAPAAARFPHRVAGKWPRTARWPHVNFAGRCAFPQVRQLHESGLATVLLLPDRYARAGQMTQRLFEAVLAGCLPITPATLPFAEAFTPRSLHAATGDQVASLISDLIGIAGTTDHAALITECVRMLDPFRLSRQLAVIDRILRRLTDASSACPAPLRDPAG